jgi:chorismate mutase
MDAGQESKGMGMTEQQERLAQEREEIATRVANFKAMQEKFQRAREEYFVTTLENARNGSERRRVWS